MFRQVRVLVLLAVCAAGCSQTSAALTYADLIGDWETKQPPPRQVGLSVASFSFRADSTFTFTAELRGVQPAEEVSGTYRVEGDRIHVSSSPDMTTSVAFEFRGKDVLVLHQDADVGQVSGPHAPRRFPSRSAIHR